MSKKTKTQQAIRVGNGAIDLSEVLTKGVQYNRLVSSRDKLEELNKGGVGLRGIQTHVDNMLSKINSEIKELNNYFDTFGINPDIDDENLANVVQEIQDSSD